jgi:hypothetical protein
VFRSAGRVQSGEDPEEDLVGGYRQHREETTKLQQALAAAHGELLKMRRKLEDACAPNDDADKGRRG